MAASEHLNPQLFHGTAHIFAEGELLDPEYTKQNYFNIDANYLHLPTELQADWKDKDTISASSSYDRAASRAASKAQDKGMLFAPVYEVDNSSFSMLKDLMPHKYISDINETTAVSKEKVKPLRIAGWGVNPLASTEGSGDNFYTRR